MRLRRVWFPRCGNFRHVLIAALSTGNKVGLGLVGLAFVVFALLSAFLLPTLRPDYPGKRGLPAFLTLSVTLFVNGPGVDNEKTPVIDPGKTAKLTVDLKTGTYDVYCSVPGHKQAGMDVKLKVS